MKMEVDSEMSDEEYLISRAKSALKEDPITAKAWMITAKSLYPNNFTVQFEAYKIEKSTKNVKEAAKYLSDILGNFQQQPQLWQEIDAMTTALRLEPDALDVEGKFLCDMFQRIPLEVQHQLLLVTADHCEDTTEHCRLILLLLRRFPQTVATHGPKLVDTLLTAEKHSHAGNQPINPYRRLLVCELLPLFANLNSSVELPVKMMFRLLNKAIEFYLCYLMTPTAFVHDNETNIEQPWSKLFSVLEMTGQYLGWDMNLMNFSQTWNKDIYWQKILNFCQSHNALVVEDNVNAKQLLYCLSTFFLYCLNEYFNSQSQQATQTSAKFILVEAFSDPTIPRLSQEPKSKRRKVDDDSTVPQVTVDKPGTQNIISNFLMACNCWELLHSTEMIQREFVKLTAILKLDRWFNDFVLDFAIYKGHYEDALARLPLPLEPSQALSRNIKVASINFFQRLFSPCFEHILLIINSLSPLNIGQLSTNLIVAGSQRHLHFLPITRTMVLQYCVRLLIAAIKENMLKQIAGYNDLSIGNLLVLIQIDWPQQEDVLPLLMRSIAQRGTFHYPLLQAYVVNVDILEELMYLWTEQGGNNVLDIFLTPQTLSQRRIGTRGADKGVKEEFKHAMRKQVSRCHEPVDQLIIKFITAERIHLLQSLM